MLDKLRKASTTWVAQILIALLVVSFAVWGVSGFFTGFNQDVVARVGNTEITVQQFARQYDQQLRQLSQQRRTWQRRTSTRHQRSLPSRPRHRTC